MTCISIIQYLICFKRRKKIDNLKLIFNYTYYPTFTYYAV